MPKNWCFWTVLLEKTPGSPLDSTEIKPVNLKGHQPWILTRRTEAEAAVFWSSDANRWLSGKVPECWWRLRTERGEAIREWDPCMASLTQGTWVWVNSGSWWWTGRPDMLQSKQSQRVGHDWATEQNSR